MIDLADLTRESTEDRIARYVEAIPDGKVVTMLQMIDDLRLNLSPAHRIAKKLGVVFNAFLAGESGRSKAMIGNPRTVAAWHENQKKLPKGRARR